MSGHGAVAAAPFVAADAAAREAVVPIENFAFAPGTIEITAGTRVVWINRDDTPHNLVGADEPRLFRSPALDTGEQFAFVFAMPGTYRYFCSLHPHMQGTVIVR
ncbi:MAG: cupredoxin family copper-binding protein [Acetobacteraceae bacterium]|nr:cupredoxin family copper-binding protein [Acetobacteraceae bacterium]